MAKRKFQLKELDFKNFEYWQTKVVGDLDAKGIGAKKLLPTTIDGINLKHLYCNENSKIPKEFLNPPGIFPFVRGLRVSNGNKLKMHKRFNAFDKINLKDNFAKYIDNGVEIFTFNYDESSSFFLGSIDKEDLQFLDLHPGNITLNFDFGEFYFPLLAKVETFEFSKRKNISLAIDPIGHFLEYGESIFSIEEHFYFINQIINSKTKLRIQKLFNFSSQVVLNAGANNIHELAYLISNAYYWIKKFGKKNASKLIPYMHFTLGVDSQSFHGVAKIRAFRFLWARLLELCGLEEFANTVTISTRFNENAISVLDPWMNMLRNTAGAFTSNAANVDYYMPFGFDEKKKYACAKNEDEYSSYWSDTMAQNTVHLLNAESHLGHVIDPMGGSFAIESLTAEMANQAWTLIQSIDESDDFFQYIKSKKLHDLFKASQEMAISQIKHKKVVIAGVNQYALKNETFNLVKPEIPEVTQYQNETISDLYKSFVVKVRANNFEFSDLIDLFKNNAKAGHIINIFKAHAQSVNITPLERVSNISIFEELRIKALRLKAKEFKFPKLRLICFGEKELLANRISFTKNYFELIELQGLEQYLDSDVFPTDISDSDIVCLIAENANYKKMLDTHLEHLKNIKNLYIAGKPDLNIQETVKNLKIRPIFLGQNVYDVLSPIIKSWGGDNE